MAVTARSVALAALARIDEGAYANLVLPVALGRSGLDARDRRFVTELVYGTTRMRRACDHLVDRFIRDDIEPEVRRVLRLGAYQVAFTNVPDHAAVSATVDVAPKRVRGLVNAVLRRVAELHEPDWPDEATRLSYPDWVVQRLEQDLGPADANEALSQMNRASLVTERADGYIQDRSSQWVAAYVSSSAPSRVADLCAAPGGKATAMASAPGPGLVVAADRSVGRVGLIRENLERLEQANVVLMAADAAHPALRPGAFDAVLVDAPCSGLGVLGRRPDARWRLDPAAPERLGQIQGDLLAAAEPPVAAAGRLYYSVCTLTAAETLDVDRWALGALGEWAALPGPPASGPWRPHGRGWLLLPQDADTDGMYVLGLVRDPTPDHIASDGDD